MIFHPITAKGAQKKAHRPQKDGELSQLFSPQKGLCRLLASAVGVDRCAEDTDSKEEPSGVVLSMMLLANSFAPSLRVSGRVVSGDFSDDAIEVG